MGTWACWRIYAVVTASLALAGFLSTAAAQSTRIQTEYLMTLYAPLHPAQVVSHAQLTQGEFLSQGRGDTRLLPSTEANTPPLSLSLNETNFQRGDILILRARVSPSATPQTVDVYVAVQLPAGTLLFLQGNGGFTPSVLPIVRNWLVAPFDGEISRYTFSGGEPEGSYRWLAAFTAPGTLNILGSLVAAPFSVGIGPGAPPSASIMCTDCNNGTATFAVTFASVMDAVQYFGAFAVVGDSTFTTQDAAGDPFASPGGVLADPPELISFDLDDPPGVGGPGVPLLLAGFGFPLVAGTETNAQVRNNYFDDGISYQVGVQAVDLRGIRSPQATVLVRDITVPRFDVTGAPAGVVGMGNDINAVVGAGVVPATVNMTTPFFPLENIFSGTATEVMFTAESIQIREGSTATAGAAIMGTVGFDFFGQVVVPPGSTPEFMGVPDTFYSRADLAPFLGLPSIGLNIRLNEHIDTTAMLTAPTLINPEFTTLATSALAFASVDGGMTFMSLTTAFGTNILGAFFDTNDGMVNIAFTADGDMIMDEDVIEIQLSNIWAPETGDYVNFTDTGIIDEAGNALTFNTTLVVANHIPAAITSAVATRSGPNDVLTLTFSRPIFIPASVFNASGNLSAAGAAGLGLVDATMNPQFTATVVGAMTFLSADRQTLTISTAMLGDLSGLTTAAVISGANLQTNDALNFLVGPGLGPLPVNTFAGGVTSIRVEDQIPPTLVNIIDGDGTVINSEIQMDGDGLLQVGDMAMDIFLIAFVFDQAVVSDMNGDGMFNDDIPASVSVTYMGGINIVTARSFLDAIVVDPTGMTLVFDAVIDPFGAGGTVTAGDTITINGVTDLAGNAAVVNMATLNVVGLGITIP